ncbi:MAG: Rieske (2Fe-2S) protein [Sporichthyaceae bacterium]
MGVERRTVLRTAGVLGLAAAVEPRTSEIPVGGGKVFAKENLVVTQPTKGDFRGFSATCTHSGCKVAEVRDGAIQCYCHNSRFRITDGAVLAGPALLPLPAEPITVRKGIIRRT